MVLGLNIVDIPHARRSHITLNVNGWSPSVGGRQALLAKQEQCKNAVNNWFQRGPGKFSLT